MTPEQRTELAARILQKGKAIVPDRFPQPSDQTAFEWGETLASTFEMLPLEIWPEAVRVWAMEYVGDRMVTPRDLRAAAFVVRDRWESHPVRRELLRARREAAVEERDRQIEAGVFAAVRGYGPRAALSESSSSEAETVGEVSRGGVEGLLRDADRRRSERESKTNRRYD